MVMSVAMLGSIIPTPLATPTMRALLPAIDASAILCTVSVVMIPCAIATASLLVIAAGMAAKPVRIRSMG